MLLVPAGSHLPDYPQESTALRCTALLDVDGGEFAIVPLIKQTK